MGKQVFQNHVNPSNEVTLYGITNMAIAAMNFGLAQVVCGKTLTRTP